MAALMVLQKPMLTVYPPATLTAWYYAVGSFLTLAVCAFYGVQPADFLFTGQWEVGGRGKHASSVLGVFGLAPPRARGLWVPGWIHGGAAAAAAAF